MEPSKIQKMKTELAQLKYQLVCKNELDIYYKELLVLDRITISRLKEELLYLKGTNSRNKKRNVF